MLCFVCGDRGTLGIEWSELATPESSQPDESTTGSKGGPPATHAIPIICTAKASPKASIRGAYTHIHNNACLVHSNPSSQKGTHESHANISSAATCVATLTSLPRAGGDWTGERRPPEGSNPSAALGTLNVLGLSPFQRTRVQYGAHVSRRRPKRGQFSASLIGVPHSAGTLRCSHSQHPRASRRKKEL